MGPPQTTGRQMTWRREDSKHGSGSPVYMPPQTTGRQMTWRREDSKHGSGSPVYMGPPPQTTGRQMTWRREDSKHGSGSPVYMGPPPPDHRPPDDLEEGGQQTWVRVSCIYGPPPPPTHTHTTTVRTDLNIPKQLPGKFRRILPCRLCNTPISMCQLIFTELLLPGQHNLERFTNQQPRFSDLLIIWLCIMNKTYITPFQLSAVVPTSCSA